MCIAPCVLPASDLIARFRSTPHQFVCSGEIKAVPQLVITPAPAASASAASSDSALNGVITAASDVDWFAQRRHSKDAVPKGAMKVPLPLTAEADAKQLAALCAAAPFGRGSKTVFDEKVSGPDLRALCGARV
jgi:hypothetical protein